MDFRRRAPRHVANWVGSCHIEGEPESRQRECRVLDMSEYGLGIVLDHPRGPELVGLHITVDSPTMGDSVKIRLEGEVRNAVRIDSESIRLGIEFDGLTELEQTVVKALGLLSVAR